MGSGVHMVNDSTFKQAKKNYYCFIDLQKTTFILNSVSCTYTVFRQFVSKFCVGPYMTPEKVYGTSTLEREQILENSRNFFFYFENVPIRKKPPKFENYCKWPIFRAKLIY